MPSNEKNSFNEKNLPYYHSVGLISIPIGRFVVAVVSLSHR